MSDKLPRQAIGMDEVVDLITEFWELKKVLYNWDGNPVEVVVKRVPPELTLKVHIRGDVRAEVKAVLTEREALIKRKLDGFSILEVNDENEIM